MLPKQRSRNRREGIFLVLISLCTIFAIIGALIPEIRSTAAEAPPKQDQPIQIDPNSSIRRELGPGAKEVFGIAISDGKLLRLSIDKGDIGLATTLYGPTGTRLLEHVSHDYELVEISFPTQVAGTYRLELQSLEKAQRRNPYELKIRVLTSVTAVDQKDSDAWQAIARAEMLRAEWTQSALRQAAGQYDRAVLLWTTISDFARASHAALKSADVYFRLSEYPEALKRYQNAGALAEESGDWLAKARALSQGARLQSYFGHNDMAKTQLTDSLALLKEHESSRDAFAVNAYGEALSGLAQVNYEKGDFLKASKQLEDALEVLKNDRKAQAKVHLFMGYIAGGIGDMEKALSEITHALELYRETNNKVGEGLALNTLGLWHSSKNPETAISLHKEAIKIFGPMGDEHSEAIVLNAIGQAYENLKDYALALNSYEEALRLFERIGALDGVSVSTFKIATIHQLNKHYDQALLYYDRCLKVSRAGGKHRQEAQALNEIATIYAKQRLSDQADDQYKKIIKFYETIGDLRGQSTALNAYGDFLLDIGQKQKALESYLRALPFSEKAGDESVRLATLYNLARIKLKVGSPEAALALIRDSLSSIEDLRLSVRSPEFRALYLSGAQRHYELCIEILMQLHKLKPGDGHDIEALLTSERKRSRLLHDLVIESRDNVREGAAKELLDHERLLRGKIGVHAQYRLDLSLSDNNSAEIADADRQISELKAEYQDVEARIRQQNPRLSELEQSTPLDLSQIRNVLRDSDTMLLEYSLGEERSYLWAVTAGSFQTYELPARHVIEKTARECYEALTARQRIENGNDYQARIDLADKLAFEIRSKLGDMLLGPLSGHLNNKKLLVITEGALQYIPFEALLVPGESTGVAGAAKTTLLETNEVVIEPSISTLIAIRGARNRPASTSKLVAVVADPVFTVSDDRVQSPAPGVAQAAPEKGGSQSFPQTSNILTRDGALQRLVHASEEADAISSVAPRGTTMVAKGFEASRETAMSSDVGQYQIIHFATHGFLDSEHPELSGIVLTRVDRNGGQTNGLVPLHDIYSLNLSAELTVLSACQTALGKEIKGEGLVGLAHGFMAAGSKSVVASLWKVDDRATSDLMADFYKAMLQQDMTPSAALRSAKLRMMREQGRSEPYYWAGFVLQGEYANRIAIDHHPWRRPLLIILILLILIAAGLVVFQKRKRRLPPLPST
jgi:CHAT domain-containing protein/Tfp pilus assembly protein PilF